MPPNDGMTDEGKFRRWRKANKALMKLFYPLDQALPEAIINHETLLLFKSLFAISSGFLAFVKQKQENKKDPN